MRRCLLLAIALAATLLDAGPLRAQACALTREDAVKAIYVQVLEREGDPGGVSHYANSLAGGQIVRNIVLGMAQSPEYHGRFITGQQDTAVVRHLYRTLLARSPDPGAWVHVGSAATNGWNYVISQLVNSPEYTDRFGDRAVPGEPVVAWDCARAGLALEPASAAPVLERDLCLTIAAGSGAAYECGDLRLAHALPTIRTLNKPRTPVLLYNSQHADPQPVVGAYLTLPPGVTADRVTASLVSSSGVVWTSGEWPAWAPGEERRIALTFNARSMGLGTGVHAYTLQVSVRSGGNTVATYSRPGEMGVINRHASLYGAGWWPAGVEELFFLPNGRLFWVGGDGSFRVYRPVEGRSDRWAAAHAVDRPDTLYTTTYPWAAYERRLPGGVTVVFAGHGKHVATRNRLDHHTHFGYHNDGQLGFISAPWQTGYGGQKVYYRFHYEGPGGRLSSITAPDLYDNSSRTVRVGTASDGRVGWIEDPDTSLVQFSYAASRPWVPETRTDRRQTVTRFGYDAGGKLASSKVEMQGTGDDLQSYFVPHETRGIGAAVRGDGVFTIHEGPRLRTMCPFQGPCISPMGDYSRFWIDRWGAPRRIVNPLGDTTVLTRGNSRLPALVTRVRAPNGLETSAEYNARGNVVTSTVHNPLGDGRNAITSYQYDDPSWPDFVSQVTMPEKEVVRFGYHTNGLRAWEQPGTDMSRRVNYLYNALQLVDSVAHPVMNGQNAAEVFRYDQWGNLQKTRTPLGHWTEYQNDALGRTWKKLSPIDGVNVATTETTFDGAGRPKLVASSAPMLHGATPGQLQTVAVENHYDKEGNVRRVDRWSTPDPTNVGVITTRWDYDAAGRAIREWAPDATPANSTDNPRDSTVYDPAGNPTVVITRRGDTIRTRFDRMGRPEWRSTSARRYAAVADSGIPARTGVQEGCDNSTDNIYLSYPYYPSNPADCSLTIPGDTTHFGYDQMGNLRRAENRFARVRRGYHPNGQLRADTLKIQTLALNDTTKHVYALGYTYDLNGRRTVLHHPAGLAPAAGAVTRYTYAPVTGELESVTDPLNHGFTFQYDQRGQLSSRTFAANARRGYGYDRDGRLTRDTLWVPTVLPGGPLDIMDAEYDQRGKLLFSNNLTRSEEWMRNRYSGLGHLVEYEQRSRALNHANNTIKHRAYGTYQYDALGNTHVTTSSHARRMADSNDSTTTGGTSTYEPYTGRQTRVSPGSGTSTSYAYDRSGNQDFQVTGSGTTANDRVSYYAADGTLRFAETRSISNLTEHRLTWEEYRYDPLGRRILVRERNWCDYVTNRQECSFNTIRRTVWDGDQVLYEIQMEDSDLSRENDTERSTADHMPPSIFDPNVLVGRVLLTHGPGMDQPLSVIRMRYVQEEVLDWPSFAVIPIWNSQGRAPYVMFSNGQRTLAHPAHPTIKLGTWWLLAKEAYGPANNAVVTSPSGYDQVWLGSVMEDQQDASGLLYRRNRYYDPATGRFTQEDPIGLAGGLNLYGFAAGDPVTYGDPYGLCPDPTAMGLGSLQCAIQDIVGALRASPRIMAGFVSEAVENPFLRRLGSIPFTFAGGGGGAVVGGVRRATVVEGHIARIGAKLANQLSHVDARHLQIAKAEMRGAQTGYDHVTEVNEAMGGLRNTIGDLNRILADERLTRDERGAAQRLLSMASRALDRAEDYLSR